MKCISRPWINYSSRVQGMIVNGTQFQEEYLAISLTLSFHDTTRTSCSRPNIIKPIALAPLRAPSWRSENEARILSNSKCSRPPLERASYPRPYIGCQDSYAPGHACTHRRNLMPWAYMATFPISEAFLEILPMKQRAYTDSMYERHCRHYYAQTIAMRLVNNLKSKQSYQLWILTSLKSRCEKKVEHVEKELKDASTYLLQTRREKVQTWDETALSKIDTYLLRVERRQC